MVLSAKCVAPVRVNGTNEIVAKPLSAEVLCTRRRDGEVVCCCEEAQPGEVGVGRRSLIVLAGLWPGSCLETRGSHPWAPACPSRCQDHRAPVCSVPVRSSRWTWVLLWPWKCRAFAEGPDP